MDDDGIRTLPQLAHAVEEHLLGHIEDSIESCRRAYLADEAYNDNYVFGTMLWRNLLNRFREVAAREGSPFEHTYEEGVPLLRTQYFSIRHHRVNPGSEMPSGAKAAKAHAQAQLELFENSDVEVRVDESHPIIGIKAEPETGLGGVFVGVLEAEDPDSNTFRWNKRETVYDVTRAMAGADGQVPAEELDKPIVRLDTPPQESQSGSQVHITNDETEEATGTDA